jgi:hypothetical protein
MCGKARHQPLRAAPDYADRDLPVISVPRVASCASRSLPRTRRSTGRGHTGGHLPYWLMASMFFSTTAIVFASSSVGWNSTTSEPAKSCGVWPGGA